MSDLSVAILVVLVLSGAIVWLLLPRDKRPGKPGSSPFPSGGDSLPAAEHYRYFPQIRQALSAADTEYLREVAPPHIVRQVLRERRAVARHFLSGLHEDFTKLERLARMIAALSPVISREQETERFLLSLRFRMLYALVWMRLSVGRVPLQQIEHLTGLVGRLALRMEQDMAQINALSVEHLPRGFNA